MTPTFPCFSIETATTPPSGPQLHLGPGPCRYRGMVLLAVWLGAVVTNLERGAAFVGSPGAVLHAGRPAGVHAGREGLSQSQVDERAFQDPDLFPEIMPQRPIDGRVAATIEPQ